MNALGSPRLHVRVIDSTNVRLRELAAAGAPHGTLVTAGAQMAGRGRQGRAWSTPPGTAILSSWLIREPPALLSLRAGLAVADLCGPDAEVKWPNDVLLQRRKVSGVLVEGRPQERWAVLGIGVNVAIDPREFPPELQSRAGSLGLRSDQLEPTLERLRQRLTVRLREPLEDVLADLRARDALLARRIAWADGSGVGAGIADDGCLLVDTEAGRVALDAGEVHLSRVD